MASPSEQKRALMLMIESARSVLGAIMSVGVQIANPKAKPDSVVEKSLLLADSLLKNVDAERVIQAWIIEKPTDNIVAKFEIEDASQAARAPKQN